MEVSRKRVTVLVERAINVVGTLRPSKRSENRAVHPVRILWAHQQNHPTSFTGSAFASLTSIERSARTEEHWIHITTAQRRKNSESLARNGCAQDVEGGLNGHSECSFLSLKSSHWFRFSDGSMRWWWWWSWGSQLMELRKPTYGCYTPHHTQLKHQAHQLQS